MAIGLRQKGLRFVGRFALVLLGLILALVFAEVAARVYVRWFRPDLPNAEPQKVFTDRTASFTVTYKFADGGIRQPCRAMRKSNPYNLAVLGDSFAFGVGVTDCEDFPSLVNLTQKGVAVYNLGQPAAGLSEYREMAETRVCRAGFNGTFVLLFGNDFLDGSSGMLKHAHKYSKLAWLLNMQLAVSPPGETTAAVLASLGLIDGTSPGTPMDLPEEVLSIPSPDGGKRLRVSLANDIRKSREFAAYLSFPPPDLATSNLEKLDDLLTRLKECSGDVWVALVPNGAILSRQQRDYVRALGGDLPPLDRPEKLPILVRKAALDHGAYFVETNEAFAADADLAYFKNDVHWTARGHQIMANVLIDALAQQGIVKTAP